jgi:hypothetical protein
MEAVGLGSLSQDTSKLCQLCRIMLSNWKMHAQDNLSSSRRRQNLADLKKAALEHGCTLCYQFWRCAIPSTRVQQAERRLESFHTNKVSATGSMARDRQVDFSMSFSASASELPLYTIVSMLPAMHSGENSYRLKGKYTLLTTKHRSSRTSKIR